MTILLPASWLSRLQRYLRMASRLLGASLRAWIEHRASSKGAALAFYTVFSIMPILVPVIGMVGGFLGVEAAQRAMIATIADVLSTAGAQTIQSLLQDVHRSASGWSTTLLAGALLVFAATSVFVELKASLDELWGVQRPTHSAWFMVVRTQLISCGLILLVATLLLLSLLISTALGVITQGSASIQTLHLMPIASASAILSTVASVCLFALIYKLLTEAPLAWADAWVGALFTALLFGAGKSGIALYLAHSSISTGFGAAGSVIVLLLWVYYSAQIFFFGAEFTRQYALTVGSLRDWRP